MRSPRKKSVYSVNPLYYSIPDKYFGQKPQRFAKPRAVWPNGFLWKTIDTKNITQYPHLDFTNLCHTK
ncbi:hypothetical protein THIOM_003248 [Candidatus Thiomargarita nelsonii]|uniref:Uncharacterized protein n=1 Tax=Candidatus Thiomargarita nelsonii TaxID=1003181 RepID=A0A176RZ57_9GAMM|nr:hypothetical protein THIOM_003248 [Candidatus Thiomargarita nelsonii]